MKLADFFLGRIHLLLNKTLMDDTSIKRTQIKTFLSNFVETWWSCSTHVYYNLTKFQQNWINKKKFYLCPFNGSVIRKGLVKY